MFDKPFPLFIKNSPIKFPKLEHLELKTNNNEIFENLITNMKNIINLRYFCIIGGKATEYKKIIIKECILFLKKLHTLIIGIPSDENIILFENNKRGLFINNKNEMLYPELKDTNIKFYYFS